MKALKCLFLAFSYPSPRFLRTGMRTHRIWQCPSSPWALEMASEISLWTLQSNQILAGHTGWNLADVCLYFRVILFKVVAHWRRFSQYFVIGLDHNYILHTLYVCLVSAADKFKQSANPNQDFEWQGQGEKNKWEMPTAITPRLIFRLAARTGLVTQLHLYHGHRGAQQSKQSLLLYREVC